MGRIINPNLVHLQQSLKQGKTGSILEGSSRSGKTWSSVDFIVYLCSTVERNATINIIKETYNSFKTTLYDDFNRRLPAYGISSPFADKQEVHSFKLFGNKINLLGADKESKFHGAGCDYFYINEAMDVSNGIFDQAEQRCRKYWWMDYNPKATQHWIFDKVCNRPDVTFLKTTFLDNPFISTPEKRKVLSYEPTHPEDRHLPREKRRPHPINIAAGTADEYMWDVYGLGLRSAPEGLIFKDVTYIDEFPTNLEKIYFGSDIGKTNSPSTAVKVGVDRKATVGEPANMYLECLGYEPTPSTLDYVRFLKTCFKDEDTVWADSAEPGFISAARTAGMRVLGVNKFPGSIMYGIGMMKNYKINIVKNKHYHSVLKEQTNYKFREVNGIRLDEPIDDFNHFWDGARYPVMSNLR
jgi:phage terminase large subunit